MNDLERQLREYIDKVVEPVTVDEVTRPQVHKPLWRARPWIAVAAGAAAVLLPAIVIISIAQLTPTDTTVDPATSVPPPPTDAATTTDAPSTTTVAPATPVDLVVPDGGIAGELIVATWQGLVEHDRDQSPNVLASFDAPALEGPAVASDRNGGVYLATDGLISYYAPGADAPTMLPVHPDANPTVSRSLAWLSTDGSDILLHFGDGDDDFYGYDVAAEQPWRDGVSDAFANGFLRVAGDRFALLTDAAGADKTLASQPIGHTYLNVGDESSSIRIKVSSPSERVVQIHDFDGRRVLLSRKPFDPAGAATTYLAVDIECEGGFGCVLVMVEQPGTAALTRRSASNGPVRFELTDLGACSAEGTESRLAITGDATLPNEVSDTRSALLRAAAICDVAAVHQIAVEHATTVQMSHGYVDGIAGSEIAGFPTLATIVALFQEQPAFISDGTHVWPAIANPEIDWLNLSAEEESALVAEYGEAVVIDSREFGFFPGLSLHIDSAGNWTYYGRPLS